VVSKEGMAAPIVMLHNGDSSRLREKGQRTLSQGTWVGDASSVGQTEKEKGSKMKEPSKYHLNHPHRLFFYHILQS